MFGQDTEKRPGDDHVAGEAEGIISMQESGHGLGRTTLGYGYQDKFVEQILLALIL